MATNYKNFKEKLSEYLAANPNTTKAQIADIKKKYRSEYTRMIKLAGASDNKFKLLATMNTAETLLLRQARLDADTRKALFEGTLEEFFTRADAIHSAIEMADFIEEALEENKSQQTAAFEVAQDMASPDVYESPQTEAEMIIDQWWHGVKQLQSAGSVRLFRGMPLPTTVFDLLKEWKDQTIALIGKEAFADLIEHEMSYNVDASYGSVDWVEFFQSLYDETNHEYESDEEVGSRISFWIKIASEKATEYLAIDDDMGDYDRVSGDIINKLSDITTW